MSRLYSCGGCGRITTGRYCPECKPPSRRSPTSAVSSGRIARLRSRLLRLRPVCEVCDERPSVELHHVKAVSTHPHLALVEANAVMACRPCHRLAKGKGATLRELKALASIAGLINRP